MADKRITIKPDATDENSDWIKIVIDKRLEKKKKVLSEKDIEDNSIKIAIIDVVAEWWEGRKFKHPSTEHMVLFKSLPAEEQKRLNDMVREKKDKTKEKPEKDKRPNAKTLKGKYELLKNIYNDLGENQWDLKHKLEAAFPYLEKARILEMDKQGAVLGNAVFYLPDQYAYLFMDSEFPNVRKLSALRVGIEDLHKMIQDEDGNIRLTVAERIDQKGLYKMVKDKNSDVRMVVAERIDQDGLKDMMNDTDSSVKMTIVQRIDKKYCNHFIDDPSFYVRKEVALKTDQEGLLKLLNDKSEFVRREVAGRIDEKYLPVMMKDEDSSVVKEVAQRIDVRYLSKMLKNVVEGVQEFKGDAMRAIAKRLSQDELHKLLKTNPPFLGTIKAVIVQRVDQIGLKMMMNDEVSFIRETAASRIDLKELPNMMNDEDSAVRDEVSKRIDYKNLLKMIKKESGEGEFGIGLQKRMKERRMRMDFIGLDTIEEFKKTGNLNIDKMGNDLKQTIKNIDGDSIKSEECSKCIDELYAQTKYNLINGETRREWLKSSNGEGAAVLKEVIKTLYGGKIRHHDDVGEGQWNNYLKNAIWRWNRDDVFNYVKIQKDITKKLLDLKYPGKQEFFLYRGTKAPEEKKDIDGKGCKILTNSLSSWTLKKSVANSFGNIILGTKFKKDEIFSCFLTHSHSGYEAEFITIGKEDKIGEKWKLI